MKKFFPAIFLVFIFISLLISQMMINGKELSASRMENNREKLSVYENQFAKLSFKTSKGTSVTIRDIKKPIVIINFWASWCRPCLSEFESLNQLIEKHGDKVFVLGINNDTDDVVKTIAKIEIKHKLKFESIADEKGSYADLFKITRLPSSIIYQNGKVIEFSEKEYNFMSKKLLTIVEKAN